MPSSRLGVTADAGEFGADVLGGRMVQVVEDRERLPPGVSCLWLVTGGLAGIAEVRQDVGLAESVPDFPDEGEGVPVAVGGAGQVAEQQFGVAEAVPDVCLAVPVA
jgi:hypothetical protein